MPNWSHELPSQPKHNGFDLRRTPTDRPLRAIVTSETLFVCFTHFWGGRTVPCESPDCDACKAMSPGRAHVYLSAIDPATRDHFIFECTATAAVPLQAWMQTYQTLRGCFFQASRPKRRRNAKVEIICKPADQTKITLPQPPDIPRAMSTIWNLPGAAVQAQGALNSSPQIVAKTDEIDRMRFNPADLEPTLSPSRGNGRG